METGRAACACAVIAGCIYVVGGYDCEGKALDTAEVYDTVSSSSELLCICGKPTNHDFFGANWAIAIRLHIIRSVHRTKRCECTHHTTRKGFEGIVVLQAIGRWSTLPGHMLEGRIDCGVCCIGGAVLVVGGRGKHGRMLKSCEMYDTQLAAWRSLEGQLSTARAGMGLVCCGDKVYAIAGRSVIFPS